MITAAWRSLCGIPWRWLCFGCLLLAVGGALYLVLPPTPRWRLPGDYRINGFADDGRVVVVTTPYRVRDRKQPTEFRFIWIDTDSGRQTHAAGLSATYYLPSPDFRTLAAGDGNAFWFIDTATGRKTTAEGQWRYEENAWQAMKFSGSGRWLARRSGERGDVIHLFDTTSGAIHKRWDQTTFPSFLPGSEHLELILKTDKNERLAIWDADRDRYLAMFGPYASWFAPYASWFAPAVPWNRYLVGIPADDSAPLHVVDLVKRDVIATLPVVQRSLSRFNISHDGRQGTFWFFDKVAGDTRVEIWDLHAGVKRSQFAVEQSSNRAVYSSGGSRVAFYYELELNGKKVRDPWLQVFDVATGKELWRRPRQLASAEVGFSSGDKCVGIRSAFRTFEFLDAETGAPWRSIPLFRQSDWLSAEWSASDIASWSDDRHYLVFCHHDVTRTLRVPLLQTGLNLGKAHEICVLDVHRQRVAANLRIPDVTNHRFTTYGPTLLTCQDDRDGPHLTAWDMPPRKRWRWIIGGPVALGVVLAGWRRWRLKSTRTQVARV
jgi:hypothetical protein